MAQDDVRVPTAPGLRGYAPEPAAQSQPEALVPSRVLHLRNGRADRHPQTYGEGVTWCGKKLLGKPDCSIERVEIFTSYGAEVHVTAFDPGTATCARCREAFDAAYSAAFPDGLKPIATISIDNPRAKELLGPATMTRFFGPQGEGASAYERFVASIESGGRDAGCSMGVGCDEYGVCYASAHGRPEMCPRDSDASLAKDAKRLSPEGVAARAEGIAQSPPEHTTKGI